MKNIESVLTDEVINENHEIYQLHFNNLDQVIFDSAYIIDGLTLLKNPFYLEIKDRLLIINFIARLSVENIEQFISIVPELKQIILNQTKDLSPEDASIFFEETSSFDNKTKININKNVRIFFNKLRMESLKVVLGKNRIESGEYNIERISELLNTTIDKVFSMIADAYLNIAYEEELKLPMIGELTLYKDWKSDPKNAKRNAIDALNEIWGEYIKSGLLSQDILGGKHGFDPSLLMAVKNYARRNYLTISDILPSKKDRISREISEMSDEELRRSQNIYRSHLRR